MDTNLGWHGRALLPVVLVIDVGFPLYVIELSVLSYACAGERA